MTKFQLDTMLKDLSEKLNDIKNRIVDAGVVISNTSLASHFESNSDTFVEGIIPKIRDFTGARGIYYARNGKRYRVHVTLLKSLTEQDQKLMNDR